MKANQMPQFRRLGADRNKGGISNTQFRRLGTAIKVEFPTHTLTLQPGPTIDQG